MNSIWQRFLLQNNYVKCISVIIFIIIVIFIFYYGSNFINKIIDNNVSRHYLMKYLKDDGIDSGIKKCSSEDEIIGKVKEHYELKKYDLTYLKKKLVLLNNRNIRNNTLTFTAEIAVLITLIVALYSNTLTILGKFENIGNSAMNSKTVANQQIQEYQNKINELTNHEKGADESVENYNQKINEIKDKLNKDVTDDKDNFNSYLNILSGLKNFVGLMFIGIVVIILIKIISYIKFENRNIATNIHKSIVEEMIEKEKIKDELQALQDKIVEIEQKLNNEIEENNKKETKLQNLEQKKEENIKLQVQILNNSLVNIKSEIEIINTNVKKLNKRTRTNIR